MRTTTRYGISVPANDNDAFDEIVLSAAFDAVDAVMVGKIGDVTLAAPQSTIDFQNIPASFAHLRLEIVGRSDAAAANAGCALRINNDGTADYDYETFIAQAATNNPAVATGQGAIQGLFIPAATAPASTPGEIIFEILNYAGTVFFKKVLGHGGYVGTAFATSGSWQAISAVWKTAAAINRLTLSTSGNFIAGSRATLYGLP